MYKSWIDMLVFLELRVAQAQGGARAVLHRVAQRAGVRQHLQRVMMRRDALGSEEVGIRIAACQPGARGVRGTPHHPAADHRAEQLEVRHRAGRCLAGRGGEQPVGRLGERAQMLAAESAYVNYRPV